MSISKGRVEYLQDSIIESMFRAYAQMDWYKWRIVFAELLKDETIKKELKQRGLHVDETTYRGRR